MRPAVSVLLSAYNAERTLAAALRSIADQTFLDWECIVIDDGSTDATAEVARRFVAADARFRLFENPRNLGLPSSLNKGLLLCRGDIIARADADDVNEPERLARQVAFLREHEAIDVVGSAAIVIGRDSATRSLVLPPEYLDASSTRYFKGTLLFHSSAVIRRTFFEKYGLYDSGYRRSQDLELWLRGLTSGARIANLSVPLIQYRSGGYRHRYRQIAAEFQANWKIGRTYGVEGFRLSAFRMLIGLLAIKWGLYTPRALRSDRRTLA